MKRHTLFLSLATAAALVLSACTITVEPGPPPPRSPDDTQTAENDFDIPVATYNLGAGADILVRVNVSTSSPALYLELDRNIDLEVFGASRSRIASSSSSAYFGRGESGLTTTAALDSQAVGVEVPCRGSCVILDQGTSSHYYVLITNTSGGAQSVALYAFGDTFADGGEPSNDVMATAPYIDLVAGDSGALEVLGDVDYWRVTGSPMGTILLFDPPPGDVGATLRVIGVAGGTVDSPDAFGQFEVRNGETIEVTSSNNRAAASASSIYYISRP